MKSQSDPIPGKHETEDSFFGDSRLYNILNQLNAGIAQADTQGRLVAVNDRFCEVVGYSREELMTRTMMSLTHPDDLQANMELFKSCVAEGRGFFLEKRYIHKSGSVIWVNNSVSAVTGAHGQRLITAVSIDITEHKKAEQAVRESEERYQNFIRRSTEGIWRFEIPEPIRIETPVEEQIDHLFRHAFLAECNDAMAQMYGYNNAQELTGARLSQFFPRNNESEAYLGYFIQSGYRVDAAESEELDRYGNKKYFINNLIGIVENGMVERAWGTQRDITEMKAAEEELRNARDESEKRRRLYETLTNSTPDLIYVFDLNYRFTYANKALLNMWGKTWDEAIGKTLIENGYEQWHAEMHEREIDQVIATKESIRGEVSFLHATLGRRIYDYIFSPVINENGEVEAIAGTTRDITSIKLAEKNLAEKLERLVTERTSELHRSNQDLQQFAHVASHDLKEPVRKFRVFAGRLKDEYGDLLPAEALRYIHKMDAAAERMNAMIEGVLKYSSLNAVDQAFETIDLNKLMRSLLEDLEIMIQQKRAEVVVEPLPAVLGAPILIYQLFYNLLFNSLKFSDSLRAPVIRLASEKQKAGTGLVTIVLEDNGIGFTREEASNIFEPFVRLHAKDKFEGTGLGLALCRNIVDRHKGTIRAEGEKGKGARFIITLPAV